MKWWNNIKAWFKSWFSKKVPQINPTQPLDTTPWPSHRFDKFLGHGYPTENSDRVFALEACKTKGLDCLRCIGYSINDEVAVHILHWRSPVDGKFKLGAQNWYEQGLARGVTRYQFEITGGQATRWKDFVKDYDKDTVQFITQDVKEVQAIITDRPILSKVD